MIADNGASSLQLKRAGRWQSSSVAEGYVSNSKTAKMEIASLVNTSSVVVANASKETNGDLLSNCSFSNCSVVINYNKPL